MLFDIVEKYTKDEIEALRSIWVRIIEFVSREHDSKKIMSFMAKTAIIQVDQDKHIAHIGVGNEFLLMQIKKFFHKSLVKATKATIDPQATIQYHVYTALGDKGHVLLLDLQKFFKISVEKQDVATYKKNSESLELANEFGIKFRSELTFGTLVVGANNNFAVSAAQAVVDQPGQVYNPLFIYGGVGLGKTHILQAIGQEILARSDKIVLYLPGTTLIDAIVDAIRKNKLTKLKSQISKVDVLLLDDIQFLAGKEKTQEVFLDIFNELVMRNKQIVLTSDQPPKDLVNIEARLKSRFAKGLVADVQAPQYEMRLAILQEKCKQRGESLDFDLLAIIAQTITNNIRELEGALNIVITRKKLTGCDVTESTMYECLAILGYSDKQQEHQTTIEHITQLNTRSATSFGKIVEFVSMYYNVPITDLKSEKRNKEITQARQMLMMIAKENFNWTLERIGDYFGGKNHATVIYACNNFRKKMRVNKTLNHDYSVVIDKIGR